VRIRQALTVAIAFVLSACGGDGAENPPQRDRAQDVAPPQSCAPAEAKLSSVFRPLPARFEYQPLPDDEVQATLPQGFRANASRAVLERDRPVGLVTAQVSSTPIRDEAEHLRGAAAGLKADGPVKSVRMNGREVQRVTAPVGTVFVSIYGACTVVYVLGANATDAEAIARAVHR
jgi:hypothetical protein